MSSSSSAVSIWQTITYFINDSSDGFDSQPLRNQIANYLIGEPLAQIGTLEEGFIYTEVSIAEGLPDAFALSDNNQTLNLLFLVGRLGNLKLPEVKLSEISQSLESLATTISSVLLGTQAFTTEGRDGLGEFVYLVQEASSKIKKIDVKVIALGSIQAEVPEIANKLVREIKLSEKHSCPFLVEVFDIPTLQAEFDRSAKSGTVDLDLIEYLGHPLRCLKAPSGVDGFDTYLAIIPGDALANIYYRWKTRILQKNLRNFLQAKGKINRGIQETLLKKPERFLAYNNGLTITASQAVINESQQIVKLCDFQIVNGGQTTASLDFFKRLSNIEESKRIEALKKVSVQAKITVVDTTKDPEFINDVSNYANSQNKVNLSDFGARDKFQETLAALMRDNEDLAFEWDNGDINFWYYEAFRGGHLTSKFQLTGNKRAIFERAFPKDQVITKLDLAKCENSWDGYPHFVCRGAEKNFLEWRKRTLPQSRLAPDLDFCKELVAKFLLFRRFESLVKKQGFPAFKSQISAISYSYFRYLLEIRNYEVDLNKIWETGWVPEEMNESILLVIRFVADLIRKGAGEEDPAQWAKKQTAWESFKETTKTNSYPKIVGPLKSLGALRKSRFHLQVACTKAMEEIEKSRFGLVKVEILQKLGLDSTYWEQIRQTLLRDYEIIQTGFGSATRYKKS